MEMSLSFLEVGSGLKLVSETTSLGKYVDEFIRDNRGCVGARKTVEGGNSSTIKSLQNKTPQQLLEEGWQDVTNPKMAENTTSREFLDPKTGLKIRFDKGVEGANGFEAVDHYHINNPNYSNKKVDYYFDIDGNPVGKGSKASHIVIGGD